MKAAAKKAAIAHAEAEYPREACGLVVVVKGREKFWPCKNLATEEDSFVLDPKDYAAADDAGEIVAVFHSHPNMQPTPSMADRAACEASGVPWYILGWPCGNWEKLSPEGYKPPLIGREWCYGTLDCYSLVRDWYKQNWGLELSDYERHGEWWFKGLNTFVDNFKNEDFVEVDQESDPQHGDALLMQIVSPVPNHVAIYLEDNIILHHLEKRLSSRDILTGYYRKNTTHILRHRSQL